MTSRARRRTFGVVCVLGLVVGSGCLGFGLGGSSSTDDAEQRALDAEAAYLSDVLGNASCLSEWGTTETTVEKRANVINTTGEGTYVAVTHPYWYSTGGREADAGSEATYLVTGEETTRVAGDRIAPC